MRRRRLSLSLQALRLILREYDLHRGEVQFTGWILRALSLNNLDELVRWAQTADKMDVAKLAPVVFEAAAGGDPRVTEIIEEGARVCANTPKRSRPDCRCSRRRSCCSADCFIAIPSTLTHFGDG